MSLHIGASSLAVEDCGNGSYTASACSIRAGILTLSATVNGEMVGLPVTVAVQPGPLTTLEASSLTALHCIAGETMEFSLLGECPAVGLNSMHRILCRNIGLT